MKPTKADNTIDEIHEIRFEISDRFDGDVFAIAQDAARRQADEQTVAAKRRIGRF